MTDFEIKLERIRLVIARRDNFAWLTGGEESGVILNQETGFVYLVVTRKELTAAALWADAAKAKEELLAGLGFTVHTLNWKQPGKEQYIERLLKGKKALSDIPLGGCLCDTEAVYELEYPMTETEIERYRELGRLSDRILADTAGNIKRRMTEQEIKAELLRQCADRGVETDVLLVGADERIEKYRHCTPTEKSGGAYRAAVACIAQVRSAFQHCPHGLFWKCAGRSTGKIRCSVPDPGRDNQHEQGGHTVW